MIWPGIKSVLRQFDLCLTRMHPLANDTRNRRFELLPIPHQDVAFSIARWLTGNPADAEEVMRDAGLRTFRYLDTFRGSSFRDWLQDNRSGGQLFQSAPADQEWTDPNPSPQAMLPDRIDRQTLATLVAQLPAEYREILSLREIEDDLASKDIAAVAGMPSRNSERRRNAIRHGGATRDISTDRSTGGGRNGCFTRTQSADRNRFHKFDR
jgi:DNA-directed RNA polymerase specialized sigma24 family protein